MANRRKFLKQALGGLGSLYLLPLTSSRAFGAPLIGDNGNLLVVITNWGGMDALAALQPAPGHADSLYLRTIRPNLLSPDAGLVPLNGISRFRLHPALSPLVADWNQGKMAVVLGTGFKSNQAGVNLNSRSHFSQLQMISTANPGALTNSGFLNRALSRFTSNTDPTEAFAIQSSVPDLLLGPSACTSTQSLDSLTWGVDPVIGTQDSFGQKMAALYSGSSSGVLGANLSALGSRTASAVNKALQLYRPTIPAAYNQNSNFHYRLKTAADIAINRGTTPVRAIVVPGLGALDTHSAQVPGSSGPNGDQGGLAARFAEFASGLRAFIDDLKAAGVYNKVTIVALSEFGRSMMQNGNLGSEHGRGSISFVFGGAVTSAKLFASPASLQEQNLGSAYADPNNPDPSRGSDLFVQYDYRSVMAELISRRLGITSQADLDLIFPDATYATQSSAWLGLV